jgi:hypothetical protein
MAQLHECLAVAASIEMANEIETSYSAHSCHGNHRVRPTASPSRVRVNHCVIGGAVKSLQGDQLAVAEPDVLELNAVLTIDPNHDLLGYGFGRTPVWQNHVRQQSDVDAGISRTPSHAHPLSLGLFTKLTSV